LGWGYALSKERENAMRVRNSYTYTILPDPVGVNANSTLYAFDMNSSDEVVGWFSNPSAGQHGFLYSGGTYTILDDPGGATYPMGINANGDVVGWFNDRTGDHAFLYSGGSFTTLPDLGYNTFAEGINKSGQIVGYYQVEVSVNFQNHGFLYSGGTYITLDDPLASNSNPKTTANGTIPLRINAEGQVVGYYYDSSGNVHGFLYQNGQYTTLDDPTPGTIATYALGINDKGEIVGTFTTDAGGSYNFLYSHGHFTTLNIFRIPEDITNDGQIITDGQYSPGGYIFTPTGSVTVSSGETHIVSSGQTESGDIVLAGGTLDVLSGGTISSTVDSGTINVYGIASNTTLSGGMLEVASGGSTGSGAITFTNSGGILQLDASQSFQGVIAGFSSPSGVTEEIDLRDIVFGNTTKVSFQEAKNHLSGTMTVTDGTHTANLTLLGQYSTGNFSLASDSHGGTVVTDPLVGSSGHEALFGAHT
jgi:probable HAF family extracellular repeat protein/autotransporter passenger strand-loop-strand repeat protein